jgi:hypothetical protein
MTSRRTRSLALGLTLFIGTAAFGAAGQDTSSGSSQASTSAQGEVTPESVAALKRMSAYLMSLNTAEITSEGSLDVVTAEGQRVQLDGVTNYKIRKPGFVIDYNSDLKSRRFIYDGKNFTVVSPKLGFYATVPAPATNREVLDLAYQTYGIRLPLEDLFRWNDPNSIRIDDLKSGYKLGTATLGGVATDHYVFREEAIDWEVWIQQGDQPVPRKMVIIDRTDPAHPTFIARLNWKVNPPLTDADFAFAPTKDQKRIDLATFEGSGE